MTNNTIAIFQISTEEDLRFQLNFVGVDLTDRILKVNVRRRDTNALVQALTLPTHMTLVPPGNLTVFYSRASMVAWAKTEYEADIIDETFGAATRIMAVRFVYDEPGKLVYGVRGNRATVTFAANQATVTAIGGVGPPGPANSLTIGAVDTLDVGEDATASIVGDPPSQELNLGLPRGATGAAGEKGWTPELAVVTDGARRVQRVVDWFGGEGTRPATGEYVGPTGLVAAIGDANDIRGATGAATIPDGDKGDITTSSSGDTWTIEANAVTFAKMQDIATARILGRSTAGSGDVEELTGAQATDLLSAFVGDSGSGGTKGLVPAPTAGDAGKFLRGDGAFVTPAVIDRAYAEYTTFSTTSAVIPIDDTIPQDTEGSQILSVSLTPKSVTSRFRIRAEVPCSTVTAAAVAVVAIFRNGSADAIAANWRFEAPGYGGSVIASCEYVPGTISAVTITVRAGVSTTGSGQSIAFNGVGVGRILGGSSRATLIVEELKA